jgi:hypothetical protein
MPRVWSVPGTAHRSTDFSSNKRTNYGVSHSITNGWTYKVANSGTITITDYSAHCAHCCANRGPYHDSKCSTNCSAHRHSL